MENELILQPQEESRLTVLRTLPEQYYKDLNPKTINDVFCSFEPSIGTIINKCGETKARAAIVYLLADTLEFFNATETMSDIQVAMTVDLIIEEYPYMKTDDFKLCFKNAMKMKYGKIYNRIDGQIIMSWLRDYNKERCAVADDKSWNESKHHREEESKPTDGIFYEDYIKEMQERADNGDESAISALKVSNDISSYLTNQKIKKKKLELQEFYEKSKR